MVARAAPEMALRRLLAHAQPGLNGLPGRADIADRKQEAVHAMSQ
jgi:hypothetical protein